MNLADRVEVRFASGSDMSWLREMEIGKDDPQGREMLELHVRMDQVILAVLEGRTIGCLRFELLWSKLPFVSLLFIRPDEYQGQGVGRRMLGFLEDSLRQRGYRSLMSSAQTDNPRSQAWHRKMGFHEIGILYDINTDGTGEVFLLKQLAPQDG
ncbi:MAG: GNAT family N-acetyltransferase [candidate division WOR-3 bacterium]|nr:MAG: GNAT family N-acetyltransferase [candidate division WOR-3 bacterium]